MDKLRLITRRDLPAGAQASQLVHAAIAFQVEQPEAAAAWRASSNTIVLLAVEDEASLARLLRRAEAAGVRCAAFTEPDLGDALTAIALEPSAAARRFCQALPLALRVPVPQAA